MLPGACSILTGDPVTSLSSVSSDAINGLLSRVYLYNGNMTATITAANAVTASVSSINNFAGLWDDSSDDGVLFKLINLDTEQGVGTGIPYSQTLSNGI